MLLKYFVRLTFVIMFCGCGSSSAENKSNSSNDPSSINKSTTMGDDRAGGTCCSIVGSIALTNFSVTPTLVGYDSYLSPVGPAFRYADGSAFYDYFMPVTLRDLRKVHPLLKSTVGDPTIRSFLNPPVTRTNLGDRMMIILDGPVQQIGRMTGEDSEFVVEGIVPGTYFLKVVKEYAYSQNDGQQLAELCVAVENQQHITVDEAHPNQVIRIDSYNAYLRNADTSCGIGSIW